MLGLFRFSVYINDLPLCTDMFNMIMYADDTTLFCDINSIPDVEHSLNAELITHINYVSLKISKVTGLLYKLKSIYPITILKSIYNTLVLPHINSHGGLKSIEYTFCKNGQFEIFQRVTSGHIPNPCLKSTIY